MNKGIEFVFIKSILQGIINNSTVNKLSEQNVGFRITDLQVCF